MGKARFQETLEQVGSLSEEEQQSLVEIVRHRLVEQRREGLAKNIVAAKEDYRRGKVKRGTVEVLLREIKG
ncbi:MAG: hypothetical protein OJF47_002269 [Nitrospira sp.]|jgi:hypothetical protein|nr:MAG: hypothetical protein OJF47_002269 [Nitrospira sp.]